MRPILVPALILACAGASAQPGRAVHSHEIASEYLNEDRVVTVSVPDDYGSVEGNYPTLYVLDGEWIFDFAAGTVAFLSNDSLGHVPDMLVVGVPNTDRARDLSVTLNPEDGYESFLNFLELEVMPLIDREYRTSGFNLLYGWSSGSAICGQFMARKPELFEAYLQSGAGIGPRSRDFLAEQIPKNSYKNRFLYVNAEGGTPRANAVRDYSELIESLRPDGLRWKFEILEESTHLDVLPEGLQAGLSFVFSDFRVPGSIATSGSDAVVSYLEEVQSRYNVEVPIPSGAFVETASLMLHNGSAGEAVALLQHAVRLYPESAVVMSALGDVYAFANDYLKAGEAYESAMKKAGKNRALYLQNKSMRDKMIALKNQRED